MDGRPLPQLHDTRSSVSPTYSPWISSDSPGIVVFGLSQGVIFKNGYPGKSWESLSNKKKGANEKGLTDPSETWLEHLRLLEATSQWVGPTGESFFSNREAQLPTNLSGCTNPHWPMWDELTWDGSKKSPRRPPGPQNRQVPLGQGNG